METGFGGMTSASHCLPLLGICQAGGLVDREEYGDVLLRLADFLSPVKSCKVKSKTPPMTGPVGK